MGAIEEKFSGSLGPMGVTALTKIPYKHVPKSHVITHVITRVRM